MARQVNTTYGSALFEVAMETNTLDSTLEEVLFVKQTFLENEELMKLLLHPNIEKESKISVVESIYKGKVADEITGLLTMLINKGHQKDIVSVLDYVISAIKEEKGIGIAHISSAVELTKEQKDKIEQKLLDTTDYKEIEGNYDVDKSLIGGLVIRISDTVVDSSLKTQIANMSKSLL
ncbi:MAG: ATP synthase F1 subunit delta [Lachnospiraceae bacterium]|jgi:F-type H+-transporting ATPase subunit delta|nr:ATP synthase F1 subunit delta [Lachnospiraceae bacterium]